MSSSAYIPSPAACPHGARSTSPGALQGHCPLCLATSVLGLVDEPMEEEIDEPCGVLGKFELLEEIGRGGMGMVYRARQLGLNREVAVKVLRGGEMAGAEARLRFRAEAENTAKLRHSGIAAVYDVGEEDGACWFAMELLAGPELGALARDTPLEATVAAGYLGQITAAIQYAHENSLLHRDLKPSNILLGADGKPRVVDFGISRRLGDTEEGSSVSAMTRTGQVLGSPGYAAPEQALKGMADARTDVYGLGAVLYHLLCGRPPFQGPTMESVLMQLRENDPISPRRLNPTVPKDLETICLKCLSREPAGRYPSAAALGADLAAFSAGMPIAARPASLVGKVARWGKRRPAVAALLGLMLLLMAGTVVGGVLFTRRLALQQERTGLISQAKLLRQEGVSMGRTQALAALQRAWQIEPSQEIRTEAIAWLALPEMLANEPSPGALQPPAANTSADGLWVAERSGDTVSVRASADGKAAWSMSGFEGGCRMKLDDNGKRLAIVKQGSTNASLYSLPDGREIAVLKHSYPVEDLDWAGELIATSCEDYLVRVWDATGKLCRRLPGHESSARLKFRPHSQELASVGNDSHVFLWHAARGERIIQTADAHPDPDRIWWSQDGQTLFVAGNAGQVVEYSIPESPCFRLLTPTQEEPHSENLGTLTANFSGRFAAATDENSLRLWDYEKGRLVGELGMQDDGWLTGMFDPNNDMLWFNAGPNGLQRYEIRISPLGGSANLEPPRPPIFPNGSVLRAISADGKTLVASQNWDNGFWAILLDTGSKVLLPHEGMLGCSISPDGTLLATSSYKTPGTIIWSLPSGQKVKTIPGKATILRFSSDGKWLYLISGLGNRRLATNDWQESKTPPVPDLLRRFKTQPTGHLLASPGPRSVRLLSAKTHALHMELVPPAYVGWLGESDVAFSAEGNSLFLHTALGSACRWDLVALERELAALGMATE